MSRHLTERRQKWLKSKKEDPFGLKVRFIRDFIFSDFRSYANQRLNEVGWMFAEGSRDHQLWKLYHCELEEMNRLHCYKIKMYQEKHGRYNFKPTAELREIFSEYLHRAYELYKKTLEFCYHNTLGERDYYIAWFEKNIKRLEQKPLPPKKERASKSVEEQSVAEEQTPATVNKEDEDKEFFKAVLDELFDDDKTTVVDAHLNPEREIRVGTLVRWPEYPDRLYFVLKTDVSHCGHDNYCVIETIDHKHKSVVPITDLVWDDVDYIEVERK